MDQQFVQWLVGQTGLAGVAAVAMWMWRNDRAQSDKHNMEREERLIAIIEQQQSVFDTLIQTLKTNAEVSTQLVAAVKGLESVVGNCVLAQRAWDRAR